MGNIQVNARLTLDSPLFLYDQLSVAWNSNARWRNANANTRAASVNYNLPFGYWGVFAGASGPSPLLGSSCRGYRWRRTGHIVSIERYARFGVIALRIGRAQARFCQPTSVFIGLLKWPTNRFLTASRGSFSTPRRRLCLPIILRSATALQSVALMGS